MVKLIPLEKLLLHKTDTLVRPIIGNRSIEKYTKVKYNPNTFTFKTKTPASIIEGIETNEIESHFADIYNYLAS